MRRAFIAVPALALLLSACGTAPETSNSEFKGDEAQVAKVVDDLSAAASRGEAEKICNDILAAQLKTEIKSAGGDCVTEMDRVIKDASDYDLEVTKVDVKGTAATATVQQGEDAKNTSTFSFIKEKGGWRASALGSS
ncbi:hypothetical protein OJ997_02190 [Solirubrobacter phytolaccae]|uniref:DUF4878 domain-containing protein n=1 Tax=Solirubrobacter phytolaccae TaxID=1404360 RepID=A0A9X3S9B1_9ACTN|nr:hypothetical protein [Solirubrobacter phytolaccae]MDA0179090.1 hypothetical protein [Solirubrobacter phytolaccae]